MKPISSSIKKYKGPISPELLKRWANNHKMNTNTNHIENSGTGTSDKNEDPISPSLAFPPVDPRTSFRLTVPAGTMSFESQDYMDYSSFVRISLEMLISFNGNGINPGLRANVLKALECYDNNEFLDDDSEIESDFLDRIRWVEDTAKKLEQKKSEINQFISTLPQTEEVMMRILNKDVSDEAEKILKKLTKLPAKVIESAVEKSQPFSLDYKTGIKVYTELRMEDCFLSIIPSGLNKNINSKVKKSSANKKNKTADITKLTVSEKVGVINESESPKR